MVLTFTDELARRQGHLDVPAFATALGVPVVPVLGHRGRGVDALRDRLAGWREWPAPVVPPPLDPAERDAWIESVLGFAGQVRVRLTGACKGCPAARYTLRHRLEAELRRHHPQLRGVVDLATRPG